VSIVHALVRLLVFPGLAYALPAAWLTLWIERKLTARVQGRIGPPFFQPFFDFVKLLAKRVVYRRPLQGIVMTALPVLAGAAVLGALTLVPVFPHGSGFSGDLILLVALLEVPPLCAVLAGFASGSLYGELGATREALLGVASSLPFLTALLAMGVAAGSFTMGAIALDPGWAVRLPALLALALCLPVKLRVNPFSVANAEQEIYTGPTTEYDGARLALWEVAHGLEWVALTLLWAALAVATVPLAWPLRALLVVVVSFALVAVVTLIAAATARLKLGQAMRVYWQWGFGVSVVALVVAAVWS